MSMTTGLEGRFANMNLQPGRNYGHGAPAPKQGQPGTVRIMTLEEAAEVNKVVGQYASAMERAEVAQAKIAEAQAGQQAARKQQEDARRLQEVAKQQMAAAQTKATEASARIAQAQTQHIEGVDKIIAAFQKMGDANKTNPEAFAKIDAFRKKVVAYRQNIPEDPNEQMQRMAALKLEAAQVMQSLKK